MCPNIFVAGGTLCGQSRRRILRCFCSIMMCCQTSSDSSSFPQVPLFREGLLRRTDWEALAERQRATVFAAGALRPGQAQLDRMVAAFDALADMQPESGPEQVPLSV